MNAANDHGLRTFFRSTMCINHNIVFHNVQPWEACFFPSFYRKCRMYIGTRLRNFEAQQCNLQILAFQIGGTQRKISKKNRTRHCGWLVSLMITHLRETCTRNRTHKLVMKCKSTSSKRSLTSNSRRIFLKLVTTFQLYSSENHLTSMHLFCFTKYFYKLSFCYGEGNICCKSHISDMKSNRQTKTSFRICNFLLGNTRE